jgi:hypothetical protein
VKLPLAGAGSMAILRVASVALLVSLALMAWGILHPRPLPVIVAMSVGQGIGILGAAMFVYVVVRDLRRVMGSRGGSTEPGASAPPSEGGPPPAPPT